MKKHLSTIILILVFLTGLSLMLYPTISDWWNSFHQSKAIAQYVENVANLDDTEYEKLWKDAHSYNESLTQKADRYEMSEEEREEYESLLNVSGDGIIGYIEIPLIGCSLPIYHGTDETVLQIAVGHIEGTSLPIGGAGKPLCYLRPPGTAQCEALYQSGQIDSRRTLCVMCFG